MKPVARSAHRPRQNRLTPFGTLEATSARGLFMGNRGILHDEYGNLGRARWRHPHWIICKLQFKNRNREVFTPGQYTELFALDEATFLSAGHRPCAECRREAYDRFLTFWKIAHSIARDTFVSAREIDNVLHQFRIQKGRQATFQTSLGHLPDGTFVMIPDTTRQPRILWKGHLRSWSHEGYGIPQKAKSETVATVLTPLPLVRTIAAGYVPVAAIDCMETA